MSTKLADLRKMTVEDLAQWIAGWKEGSQFHVLGMIELKRRQEKPNEVRGWLAICISVLALILSFAAVITATK